MVNSAWAQENTCTYAQYCDAGEGSGSGQQSCTGSPDDQGICKWDPEIEPNCSICQLINTPTPTATSSPTPTGQNQPRGSRIEQAVSGLNRGLMDPKVFASPQSNSFFDVLKSWLGLLNPANFFAQSQNLQTSFLPEEANTSVQLSQNNDTQGQNVLGITDAITNPIQAINNILGGSKGFFGVNLPSDIQGQAATSSAKSYEQANFPEGVQPITGQ